MKKMKVWATEPFEPAGTEALLEFAELKVASSMDPAVQSKEASDSDAIVVRGAKLRDEVVEAAKGLKIVVRHAIGVDSINVPLCTQKGILVCNCPASNTNAVAEHVIMLMLAISKQLLPVANAYKNGEFTNKGKTLVALKNVYGFNGFEISGKTLGVVGFGKIGRLTAERCRNGFGMKIAVYDPYVYKKIELPENTFWCDTLEELMPVCDYISLHLPYSEETRNLIGEKELRLMKPTAYFINCARGGIVNEEDLYKICKEKTIAGAAIDVLEVEPPLEPHPFFELDNILVTPHFATTTEEAKVGLSMDAVKNLRQYYHGEDPFGWLNKKAMAEIHI